MDVEKLRELKGKIELDHTDRNVGEQLWMLVNLLILDADPGEVAKAVRRDVAKTARRLAAWQLYNEANKIEFQAGELSPGGNRWYTLHRHVLGGPELLAAGIMGGDVDMTTMARDAVRADHASEEAMFGGRGAELFRTLVDLRQKMAREGFGTQLDVGLSARAYEQLRAWAIVSSGAPLKKRSEAPGTTFMLFYDDLLVYLRKP